MRYSVSLFFTLFIAYYTYSAVSLPAIFGDHMVLQREAKVKIWGWADPFEPVEVRVPWTDEVYIDTTDNHANWEVILSTPEAGGPFTIQIKGYNEILITDVMIGEVWLCSGQSNMQWSANSGIEGGDSAIKNATNPALRFFQVSRKSSEYPQQEMSGHWELSSPESMQYFSAIGYAYGKFLQESLDVPIGLVHASWGGTPIEVWIPQEVISNDPFLSRGASKLGEMVWSPSEPGKVFNAMINPLIPFKIAGVIWYQGESNTANPDYYLGMFESLIQSWRNRWENDFPFYYVQIAPFNYGSPEVGVKIRDAQRKLALEKTNMVVISDLGDTTDIHPRKKLEVGKRLGDLALTKHYGISNQICEGPVAYSFERNDNRLFLSFDHAEGLFLSTEEKLFELAGTDGVFHVANQRVVNNQIELWSNEIEYPTNIRFAWGNTSISNLFNSAKLPASSFKIALGKDKENTIK